MPPRSSGRPAQPGRWPLPAVAACRPKLSPRGAFPNEPPPGRANLGHSYRAVARSGGDRRFVCWTRSRGRGTRSPTVDRADSSPASARRASSRVHRDPELERGCPARSHSRGAGVGELAVVLELRRLLGDHARDPGRGKRALARLPPLGQRRPDGVLLLRRWCRDPSPVRHGRAARTSTARDARCRRARWDGRAGSDLSRVQRRRVHRAGLGHRDGDRHGLRARSPGAGGWTVGAGRQGLPADAGHRRRHRRAHRRGAGLHRGRVERGAVGRVGAVRRGAHHAPGGRQQRRPLLPRRLRPVDRHDRFRGPRHDRRHRVGTAGDGAPDCP